MVKEEGGKAIGEEPKKTSEGLKATKEATETSRKKYGFLREMKFLFLILRRQRSVNNTFTPAHKVFFFCFMCVS